MNKCPKCKCFVGSHGMASCFCGPEKPSATDINKVHPYIKNRMVYFFGVKDPWADPEDLENDPNLKFCAYLPMDLLQEDEEFRCLSDGEIIEETDIHLIGYQKESDEPSGFEFVAETWQEVGDGSDLNSPREVNSVQDWPTLRKVKK